MSEQVALFHENNDILQFIFQFVSLTEMRLGKERKRKNKKKNFLPFFF